jgi:tetratricopeptide (TPR) repeat protein
MVRLKNYLFSVLAIIIFFALIELLLFFFKVGGTPDLLKEFSIDGDEYLEVNTNYMYRYFCNTNASIPTLSSHYFLKHKDEKTFRVYVIGESSSQGFPYSKTESFPYMFQQMLQKAVPQKNIEVINFSVSAGNSYIGLDMIKELIKYPPDLLITFYGHNELIGIGGADQYNKLYFKLNLALNHMRSFRGLKELLSSLTKKKSNSLFEEMSSKKPVELNSQVYDETLQHFNKNYHEIIKTFTEKDIPVVMMGVVSNLKDMPPFISNQNLKKSEIEKLKNEFISNNEKITCKIIDRAGKEEALIYFEMGRVLLAKNDSVMARYAFNQACKYALGRFRATEVIQKMVKNISKELVVTYIDLQSIFDKKSKFNITGNDLLLEHVHPTLDGHYLAASVLVDTVINKFKFVPAVTDYKNTELVNSLADSILVLGKLNKLFNTQQFKSISFFNYGPFKNIFIVNDDKLSFRLKDNIPVEDYTYLTETLKKELKGLDPDNLNNSYGVWLFNKQRYKEAHRKFFIAYEEDPYNTKAINNLAIMEYKTGKIDKAIKLFKVPLARNIYNNLICQNLWIVYKEQKNMKEAREMKKLIDKKKFHISSTDNLTLAY